MEHEEPAALLTIDSDTDDTWMHEYNDIGLALRLNALREPEPA
jgi:hypothetical protein